MGRGWGQGGDKMGQSRQGMGLWSRQGDVEVVQYRELMVCRACRHGCCLMKWQQPRMWTPPSLLPSRYSLRPALTCCHAITQTGGAVSLAGAMALGSKPATYC